MSIFNNLPIWIMKMKQGCTKCIGEQHTSKQGTEDFTNGAALHGDIRITNYKIWFGATDF